jgi:adenylyltransferase/sulfurtransferase
MDKANASAEVLKRQIAATETELSRLKEQLAKLESGSKGLGEGGGLVTHRESRWPLSQDEYKRYGRQMIVPNYGIQGNLDHKLSFCLFHQACRLNIAP